MRKPTWREGVYLLIGLVMFEFVWGDEEPLLDWTDLNFLHVGLLGVAAVVVLAELTLRARFGQTGSKDVQCGFAAFVFWVHLENYLRLVLITCAIHNLVTLESDLIDTAELLLTYSAWLTSSLLPALVLVVVLYGLGSVLQHSGQLTYRGRLLLLLLICVLHLGVAAYLGGDLVCAGLSAWTE
jgi:hypothetical protein